MVPTGEVGIWGAPALLCGQDRQIQKGWAPLDYQSPALMASKRWEVMVKKVNPFWALSATGWGALAQQRFLS